MTKLCSHCSRVNPAEAQYCYYDGASLQGSGAAGPLKVGAQAFPSPFVFPSGQACKNFDQLALTCQKNWTAARDLLAQGYLEKFLGGLGRIDLAQAAQMAKQAPNLDRGLDQLLSRLPAESLQPPRLSAEPSQINLGTLKIGKDGQMDLHLVNQGMRLVYGSLVSNSPWLVVSEGAGAGQRLFQFQDEIKIPVQIRGQHLRAGTQPLEGRLILESNGGAFEVVVKADVPAQPFPEGVLKGALTPRQVAEKAKGAPKEAAPLFENGAVVKWYQANGWTYPVQGQAGTGLGAVQQFFEALGLVKPPKIEISDSSVRLQGKEGANVTHSLRVHTSEKRPVWAYGRSNQPWLTVGKPVVNGPAVTLPLEAHVPPGKTGEAFKAQVTVTANGNQRFVVPVEVTIGKGAKAAAAAAADADVELVDVGPGTPRRSRKEEPVAVAAVESVRGGAARKDKAPVLMSQPASKSGEVSAAAPASSKRGDDFADMNASPALVSTKRDDDTDAGGVVTLSSSLRRRSSGPGLPWMRLAPAFVLLAGLIALLVVDGMTKGRQIVSIVEDKKGTDSGDDDEPPPKEKYRIDVEDGPEKKAPPPILHRIEPVPSFSGHAEADPDQDEKGFTVIPVDPNPRLKLLYIKAQGGGADSGPVKFGLSTTKFSGVGEGKRLTYSQGEPNGANNSTAIKINGEEMEFGKEGTWLAPRGKKGDHEIPSVWAIATEKGAKGGAGIYFDQYLELVPSKQPVKVDGVDKRVLDTLQVRWVIRNREKKPNKVGLRIMLDTMIGSNDNVPFTFPGLSSLITTKADLQAPRIPDFIQALENPSLENPGTVAHLSLRLGGKVDPPDRVLLTKWPGAFHFWDIPVMNFEGDSAVVLYWNERVLAPEGEPGDRREIGFAYGLGNVTADKGSKLGLTVGGTYDPDFTVTAYVKNPTPGQILTLDLPDGLQLVEGGDKQPVAPAAPGTDTSTVTWKAKVQRGGVFKVLVRSSDGLQQSRTITVAREETGGRLTLELVPPFEPKVDFAVVARVREPGKGEKLTLELPKGSELTTGGQEQAVPPAGADKISEVQWKMRVDDLGTYPIRVKSSTGTSRTHKLIIARDEGAARKLTLKVRGESVKLVYVDTYVSPPYPNTVTLTLPDGMSCETNPLTRKVIPPAKGDALITWPVDVERPGVFPISVASSSGATAKAKVTIEGAVSGGDFKLELSREIMPKKDFTVKATVTNPVPGQTLTLQLPDQIKLSKEKEGPLTQTVPRSGEVTWTVRIVAPGTMRITAVSSTKATKSKTLKVPESKAGLFD